MSLKLSTPEEFSAFPFKPYGIQLDLMRHLYETVEDRKVTIVESPTGTGKTLSLLCASLTWLKDEQDRARKGEMKELGGQGDSPDWVLAQTVERRRRELEVEEREYAERLAKARKKEAEIRKLAKARVRKKQKAMKQDKEPSDEDDDTFLPSEDPLHDDQNSVEDCNISPAVRALMRQLQRGMNPSSSSTEKEPVCTKIYYASRTHSQLAQVLHELRKLRIALNVSVAAESIPSASRNVIGKRASCDEADETDSAPLETSTRTVSLGSRKQLCINEDLRRRAGDLDEGCRQMLSEKGDRRCPHLPPPEDDAGMLDLRDQILATPKDIEDLVETGKNINICPYFGSRRAIPQAQLVLLPYNLLLQKTAREALGIDLTDQVVIIDEAHNLISTLLSLSTTRLPLRTLSTARQQLSIYLSRFRTRLATAHTLHLARLINLLDSLNRYAEEWRDGSTPDKASHKPPAATAKPSEAETRGQHVEVMTPGELLQRLGRKAEGVNLLEVEAYLRISKIARKISGYSVKTLQKAAGQDPVRLAKIARLSNATPPLHAVESFITALTSANDDGRVVFSIVDGQVEMKYQHLNPSSHFQDVVEAARSVVLAGGTMSPISDVVNQLFSNLADERFSTFSCGHIIPSSNLQTIVLQKGPRGGELQFKYEQRSNPATIAELGQILLNFNNIVPGGTVVFLPSYSFLHAVIFAWEKSGVMSKLNTKKKVFSEPAESALVEQVLRDYAAEIQVHAARTTTSSAPSAPKKGGAILFAVIGAKLSEGLNFADDLARAVIIIGLPFANLASPELRERMNYVNRLAQRRDVKHATRGPKDAGTELYENMCMNSVNQSIGRAIRHRGDWASLILVDGRYSTPRIKNKLPKWIEQSTVVTESFGQAMKELGNFYREKSGR
ncbi:DNA repair helicase [Wolfiporia cocos MD-104 SS10]|uniref:ATP-dependent DNA helicase CHL1 n=1 Tax=Wolfiporia cocos (strain MD-104) TaxID=742152 RepID=A0A2H3J0M6_WOLCO|nr:DNA repair helicase [Wolfiporia cocos MD-104 SS10]